MDELASEAARATEMLRGRTIRVVRRHRASELLIEFDDGTRLFIDAQGALELSIAALGVADRSAHTSNRQANRQAATSEMPSINSNTRWTTGPSKSSGNSLSIPVNST